MSNTASKPPVDYRTRVPDRIRLPGDCLLDLDRFGLPVSKHIRHSHPDICLCHDQIDEIHVKYLIIWQVELAEQVGVNSLDAMAKVVQLIQEWELQVPLWLQPIIERWVGILQSHSGQ
ncbi:hypothetical protein ANO14919_113360 [Xylariales sp. No.14919]|nr:hypothetical protein ANO14919_113360 [Xylariales sp. No.14919]